MSYWQLNAAGDFTSTSHTPAPPDFEQPKRHSLPVDHPIERLHCMHICPTPRERQRKREREIDSVGVALHPLPPLPLPLPLEHCPSLMFQQCKEPCHYLAPQLVRHFSNIFHFSSVSCLPPPARETDEVLRGAVKLAWLKKLLNCLCREREREWERGRGRSSFNFCTHCV